jgi:hypothetical protein
MASYVIELIQGDNSPHDYPFPGRTWRRGSRMIDRFGVDGALERLDERAERAAVRDDFLTAERWRDIMAVIHAIANEDPLPGDSYH